MWLSRTVITHNISLTKLYSDLSAMITKLRGEIEGSNNGTIVALYPMVGYNKNEI